MNRSPSRHLEFLVYFSQHYLDCLSQASYLIGDETTGQAGVAVDWCGTCTSPN
ncbi:MAG TPA: hypothetical protein VES60_01525 [Nakamurella sp.]|nr:hypothetical protein [Nakamurella sp.]